PGISLEESLALSGLPLTEARMETNAAGDTVLTQWFERARLEWHPNNPDPYKVLLGLLGVELRGHVPPLKTNCEQPVLDELRRHYEEGRAPGGASLRQALGCPQYTVRDVPAAVQSFERGTMIWQAPTSTRGNPRGTIFAIFDDLRPRFISYPDPWDEGQPESGGLTPPAGRFEPRRGFGKVWREQLGVREGLGWATEAEQAERSVLRVFDHGWMLWLPGRDMVYAFFYDTGEVAVSGRLK
ncbi:MAG TPA: hypothetical protein VEZ12_12620, partial [Herpetosiphonaceae bacterium]|nr:hypothetical protein [Herpetosiphonaceae bacterium]